MMLLALALSFSAFTALSLAMERHQHDLHGKAAAVPARRAQWRALGWLLLVEPVLRAGSAMHRQLEQHQLASRAWGKLEEDLADKPER